MLHAAREAYRERNRAFASFLHVLAPLGNRTLLEVGAACGANVPYFLGFGFRPEHITLNELRLEHAIRARVLFPDVRMVPGDAAMLGGAPRDVVVASTVFTSILSDAHRVKVAETMWRLTKPGGGVLLYDFTWNNPANPCVRKLTLTDIRALFPYGTLRFQRVTLAPPLARHLPPRFCRALHGVPWLRTHVVGWLRKH